MWVLYVALFSLVSLVLCEDLEEGCVRFIPGQNPSGKPKVIQVFSSGNFYSPGFVKEKKYPASVQCSYQLQVPLGRHLRLKFNELDIDTTESCQADSLNIFDFNSDGSGFLLATFCGRELPYDFVSKSHVSQLILRTDDFAEGKGFNITYSVQESSSVCSLDQKQCRNRNCVSLGKTCDGNDDCGDGTDEEKCSRLIKDISDCGKPEIDPLTFADFDRIVGGQDALPGSWPWMADLQMKMYEPNGHICGGALINEQWVLSAAHCFGDEGMRGPGNWRIHLGNYRKFEKDEYEQVRYVERVIIYDDIPSIIFEKNGEFDIVNDMALVKLNAPVKFTKHVKPVCLPDPYVSLNIVSKCYAAGWGATRGSGGSDNLKQAYHPVQPDILCKRLAGSQFTTETMICAGSMGPGNGVCHGDSGGPLMCEINKKWSIFGVASYVTDSTGTEGLCGLKGRPSVFNKVAVKTAWIRRMINRYS